MPPAAAAPPAALWERLCALAEGTGEGAMEEDEARNLLGALCRHLRVEIMSIAEKRERNSPGEPPPAANSGKLSAEGERIPVAAANSESNAESDSTPIMCFKVAKHCVILLQIAKQLASVTHLVWQTLALVSSASTADDPGVVQTMVQFGHEEFLKALLTAFACTAAALADDNSLPLASTLTVLLRNLALDPETAHFFARCRPLIHMVLVLLASTREGLEECREFLFSFLRQLSSNNPEDLFSFLRPSLGLAGLVERALVDFINRHGSKYARLLVLTLELLFNLSLVPRVQQELHADQSLLALIVQSADTAAWKWIDAQIKQQNSECDAKVLDASLDLLASLLSAKSGGELPAPVVAQLFSLLSNLAERNEFLPGSSYVDLVFVLERRGDIQRDPVTAGHLLSALLRGPDVDGYDMAGVDRLIVMARLTHIVMRSNPTTTVDEAWTRARYSQATFARLIDLLCEPEDDYVPEVILRLLARLVSIISRDQISRLATPLVTFLSTKMYRTAAAMALDAILEIHPGVFSPFDTEQLRTALLVFPETERVRNLVRRLGSNDAESLALDFLSNLPLSHTNASSEAWARISLGFLLSNRPSTQHITGAEMLRSPVRSAGPSVIFPMDAGAQQQVNSKAPPPRSHGAKVVPPPQTHDQQQVHPKAVLPMSRTVQELSWRAQVKPKETLPGPVPEVAVPKSSDVRKSVEVHSIDLVAIGDSEEKEELHSSASDADSDRAHKRFRRRRRRRRLRPHSNDDDEPGVLQRKPALACDICVRAGCDVDNILSCQTASCKVSAHWYCSPFPLSLEAQRAMIADHPQAIPWTCHRCESRAETRPQCLRWIAGQAQFLVGGEWVPDNLNLRLQFCAADMWTRSIWRMGGDGLALCHVDGEYHGMAVRDYYLPNGTPFGIRRYQFLSPMDLRALETFLANEVLDSSEKLRSFVRQNLASIDASATSHQLNVFFGLRYLCGRESKHKGEALVDDVVGLEAILAIPSLRQAVQRVQNLTGLRINQAVINIYCSPGSSLVNHIDSARLFKRPICSLHLFGKCTLSFGYKGLGFLATPHSIDIAQEPGTLTVMNGLAAHMFTHCVRPVHTASMSIVFREGIVRDNLLRRIQGGADASAAITTSTNAAASVDFHAATDALLKVFKQNV